MHTRVVALVAYCLALGILSAMAQTGKHEAAPGGMRLLLQAETKTIPMGRTVAMRVTVQRGSSPVGGQEVWTYLEGRRWCAVGHTDSEGHVTLLVPLPYPGLAHLTVALPPSVSQPARARWIWADTTRDGQTVTFTRKFTLSQAARHATLLMTCDDLFEASLNGQSVLKGNNFQKVQHADGLEMQLHPGENVLTVVGKNGTGPAGLLGRLEIETAQGKQSIATDVTWIVQDSEAGQSGPAKELAAPGEGVWGTSIQGWPGLENKSAFPIGQPMATTQTHSNGVTVHVLPQKPTVAVDPAHRVGMAWEPWFTPLNARWDTAEAVSLLGNYPSDNADVDRQQMLWMDAMGVDFLLIDWSNNIWGASHWSEHSPGVDQLVAATNRLMDTLVQMRHEGLPTPQITLLLGLINGPPAKMTALDEELQYVHDSYIAPPRYKDLWVNYGGKPLITVLDTLGPDYLKKQPPIDPIEESRFTLRWMSTRLEQNNHAQAGFWSWMDGVVHPIPTYADGKAEALTVTPAFFGDGGWTYPAAMGRRGGATYLEEFQTALELHPTFLILNQWNEFAGQAKGDGFGPKKDQYVDTYSVPLSDDIEPTSLTEEGYRGGTGWGFTYQNLTRALLQIYRGEDRVSTLLAVSSPEAESHVVGPLLKVEWTTLGRPAQDFSLLLDGKPVASHLKASPYSLSLSGVLPGRHTLTLQAEGTVTRFPLSPTQEDQPIKTPKSVIVNVPFFLDK